MSASYLAASITSISASSSRRVFFHARRENNPPIWLAVWKSSLWNILVPLISFASIIDRATDAGSAFCPVLSPSLNFLVRYDRCATVNLLCWGPVTFSAQPIFTFRVLACLVGTLMTGTVVALCPFRCSAYWTAALSYKVSCSRVYWCLPHSKWQGNEECLMNLFIHPSSGQAKRPVEASSPPELADSFTSRGGLRGSSSSPFHRWKIPIYTLFFFIRMLFFRLRLNILIFLPILGWKYSCLILKL